MSECVARTISVGKSWHNYSHHRGFGLRLTLQFPAQTLQAVGTGTSPAQELSNDAGASSFLLAAAALPAGYF